jgi:hypothetical protein
MSASAFAPFPSGALVGAQARRRVEYATGIVVDAAGRIVTDRAATQGCLVITVAGLGNAEREAADPDLALLRLYGARPLDPVPVAAADAAADNVTLVGVADPELQAGAATVTAAPARLGAAMADSKRLLEPSPLPGFSGAAALDATGALVGVVTLAPAASGAPQGLLVPAGGLRHFLERAHVALAPAAARPAADFTTGIVRVICTRS